MGVEHEHEQTNFGQVSRIRGKIFEKLSLGASVFGILMLAVLLVYVVVDAFNLSSASPEWLLTYFITLVVPFIGFCLYSANDPKLTKQAVLALGGGLPAIAGTYIGVEAFIRPVPGLTWQLIYLFTVVVPVTAYVGFAGSREPVGRVGFGLLGRLVGGTALGFMFLILFVVFEPQAWFWAYTLGFLPAVGMLAYSRRQPKSIVSVFFAPGLIAASILAVKPDDPFITIRIPLDYSFLPYAADWIEGTISAVTIYLAVLSVPAAIVVKRAIERRRRTRQAQIGGILALVVGVTASIGIGVAGFAPELILTNYADYPGDWGIYVWSLVIPLTLASAGLTALQVSRKAARQTGVIILFVTVVGSQAATVVGISPKTAVLFLLAVSIPTLSFLRQVAKRQNGVIGVVLPVLLAGGVIIGAVIVDIWGVTPPDIWLNWSFLTAGPSATPELAGFYPAIVGSVLLISLVAVFSFVLGVGTAVFLEEYAPDTGLGGKVTRILQINIANLAAVPSVVYGLLGLGLFANLLGFGLGTAITGALTLTLLILPISIVSAQEAIRAVPDSMRNGSYAMGATRWQTTKNVVLPEAIQGILTGMILSLGRAIGETAPLIMIGFPNSIFNPPSGILETTTAMPMQIYVWSSSVKSGFRYGAVAAGVVTLLIVLLLMNATAIIIRNRYQRDA
ncbi:phosphate ABC transporter permease PstA [Halovenus rubra]|uniref:Phosphate transport system permease protein PstA n=2 Tax=Halovenus rubra TaxID=869890 RepID=A0ABD5X9E4_9EURY|nr:phosphate ABC transporter permease PstA [Halovenus rubra]